MKKIAFVLVIALALTCTLTACQNADTVSEPATSAPASITDVDANDADVVLDEVSAAVAGGWNTPEDGTITDTAQEAFDKATKEGGMAYTPVALVGTQVVAGINYAFVCIGKPTTQNATPAPYLVIVYADLEGNATITSTKPITVGQ